MNNPRVVIRGEVVGAELDAIMERFRESGISPPEGMMVAELLLWTLIENLLKMAPPGELEKLRATALRHCIRLESRVNAWPARIEDRQ